ncbi:outer membrane lipoprotein-sorting protein [Pantoea ananatis]
MHNILLVSSFLLRKWLPCLIALMLISAPAMAVQKDASEWFREISDLRGLSGSFSFSLQVTSYRDEVAEAQSQLEVLFQSHQQILILFRQPQNSAGRRILVEGDNMWLTLPSSKRVLRVSPSQRLLGEASNGDVINTNFADYQLQQQQDVERDGKRYIALTLVATNSRQSYQRVVYLIDPQSSLPSISLHYTASQKLIKEIHYENYVTTAGKPRVERLRLINPVQPDRYTIMQLSQFTARTFPAGIFKKENLLNAVIRE